MNAFKTTVNMTTKGIERTWTDETRDQFIMSFPVRSNKEITSMFRISLYQMQRIARKYGLEKDNAYRISYLRENAKRASEALHQRHRYICTKMSEIKKSLVRRDKLRRAYGLSPLTKYKYADYNATRKKSARYRLRSYGYVIAKGSSECYITDGTKRRPKLEEQYMRELEFTFTVKE